MGKRVKITSKEIAVLVEGKLNGDPGRAITGAAGLIEASESDLSFLGNSKYVKHLALTKAGLVLLPEKMSLPGKDHINVKNPQLAFAMVLNLLAKEKSPDHGKGIHPMAYVAKTASVAKSAVIGPFTVIEEYSHIGENTKILANSYIGHNSRVGSNTLIYPNVTIRENITIGDNVIIHPGVVVGSDGFGFIPYEKGIFKIPQIGTVEIGSNVEIGANVTIDRATTGKTRIGGGTKIDNLVQIAHNVEIGSNCVIVAAVCIAGSTKIGNGVTIAGQAAIAGHLNVGDGAVIAGKSGVTQDVKKGEVVSGFPARPHKQELKLQAIIHKLPEIYDKMRKGNAHGQAEDDSEGN
jgi:UDP-3-O-[3-hydroxymyristoyl] glucosamine N-acyltransferase